MAKISPYLNPSWPDAVWDVSGAFVNDRELVAFHDFCTQLLGFIPFSIVHGAPLCAWNSGRVLKHLLRDTEEIRTAGLAYERRNISLYLTFTNLLLGKERVKGVNHPLIEKIFNVYAPKYAERAKELGTGGGYTRIIKLGERRGDAAEKVIIELV